MSYILDALKKADAERERGTVPGLHSQPQSPAPEDDEPESRRQPVPLVWIGAGAAAVLIIGMLTWRLMARDAEPLAPAAQADGGTPVASPSQRAATQGEEAQPSTRGEAPVPLAPVYPSKQAPAPEPRAMQHQAPHEQARPNALDAPAAPPLRRATAEQPAHGNGNADASPGVTASTAVPTGAHGEPHANTQSGATTVGQRVPSINELPDDVRRDLPQLVIGGAMYSETPANRMLIINSQVFHEGEQPYQGLMLEEIRLKSAVFKYRGYRYSVSY